MSLETINLAFDHLGLPALTSRSKADNYLLAERQLPRAISEVLRLVNWTEQTIAICMDQANVADEECDLPDGFCYAFVLPPDFVRAYDVTPHSDTKFTRIDLHNRYPNDPIIQWKVARIKQGKNKLLALLTDCAPSIWNTFAALIAQIICPTISRI